MEAFFIYLLKSSLLIALFWCCFVFFLKKETFFNYHRAFLIFGVLVALAFPFVLLTKVVFVELAPVSSTIDFSEIASTAIIEKSFNWTAILLGVYISITGFFLVRFVVQLLSLRRLIQRGTKHKDGTFTLVKTETQTTPFSFFKYIVYNPNLHEAEELKTILAHEKIHSQQYHSIDVLLSHLLCVFQWINPFAWGYQKTIVQNLEYIADDEVLSLAECKKQYQYVLLKQNTPLQPASSITNAFFNSLIKKRIVMINKNRSKNSNAWKFGIMLPILTIFLFTVNTKTIAQTKTSTEEEETKSAPAPLEIDYVAEVTAVQIVIDKNSTPKTLENDTKFLKEKKQITLDFSDINRNDKGEIIAISSSFKTAYGNSGSYSASNTKPIQPFSFKVEFDANGSITSIGYNSPNASKSNVHFDAHKRALKSQGKLTEEMEEHLDTHITEVLKDQEIDASENVNETVIISTSSDINGDQTVVKNNKTFSIRSNADQKQPLFVIDGKVQKDGQNTLPDIDPDKIKSINVLKGKSAMTVYGKKGKNGVVEITTKKGDGATYTFLKGKTKITATSSYTENPIYIVDKVEMPRDYDFEAMDLDRVKKVKIYKGEKALKKFGKRGENGVVVITTKKN